VALATGDAPPRFPPTARLARISRAIRGHPRRALAVLLLVAFALRLVWLWWPQGSLIFDETFYVNSARVMLSRELPPGSPYEGSTPGLDPNSPHPPLGKVLIAGSMLVLGDGGIGWRTPSVVAAMVALIALYGIVRASGGSPWLGVAAVGLFAFDNLSFVHGRIATLDMMALAPVLVGALLAIRGHPAMAGAACAIGTLVKLTAGFGLLAIAALELITMVGALRSAPRPHLATAVAPVMRLLFVYIAVTVGGLWLLDLGFSSFKDPWSHLQHMFSVAASLQTSGGPQGIASDPWQWLVNEVQINYLRVAVDTSVNGAVVASQPTIDFRGAINPALIGAAPLAFLYALWLGLREHGTLARWCVVWAAANYLPYYALVLIGHRITYLYYVLPVIPALAVAVALLIKQASMPRLVQIGYAVAVGWGFLAYFPFRQLP
jgi:predicted membrane-bound dolichyl-phosphate-mannose-protein mannosyltransferase